MEAERTKQKRRSLGRIAAPVQVLSWFSFRDSLEGRSEFPQVPASPNTKSYGGERAFGYLFEGRRK